jgi:hypothetical protein
MSAKSDVFNPSNILCAHDLTRVDPRCLMAMSCLKKPFVQSAISSFDGCDLNVSNGASQYVSILLDCENSYTEMSAELYEHTEWSLYGQWSVVNTRNRVSSLTLSE